ncbi:hypothetical protein GcC1_184030 [Golovinomyces cichoracearum]|uniref:Serine threonine-protein kinase ppk6 n=1 Tax=Golovinomyces cichoracearum TaxID=62708 RepID=A0A420HL28_9PEZI|nr:hypothetical protein GcC1_184030 [Golovinomyces cichoracearum]
MASDLLAEFASPHEPSCQSPVNFSALPSNDEIFGEWVISKSSSIKTDTAVQDLHSNPELPLNSVILGDAGDGLLEDSQRISNNFLAKSNFINHNISNKQLPRLTLNVSSCKNKFPWGESTTTSTRTELLFDAINDLEENEEFGEFQTDVSSRVVTISSPQMGKILCGLKELDTEEIKSNRILPAASNGKTDIPSNCPSSNSISSYQARFNSSNKSPNHNTPVTAWPTCEPNHQWVNTNQDSSMLDSFLENDLQEFAVLVPGYPSLLSNQEGKITSTQLKQKIPDREIKVADPDRSILVANITPPSNIPPPSVLLSLFVSLLDLSSSTELNHVIKHQKNNIPLDASTIDFIRRYLINATVAAYIIAGRKLRWKRDTHLSKSMNISTASLGGTSGMKLASLNKSENLREDQEVANVFQVWKDQLGKLRSSVMIVNSNGSREKKNRVATSASLTTTRLMVPEITSSPSSLLVKAQIGALKAPKPCIICGLKRDERVQKVDFQVEDSFGEFWTEFWGHTSCRNFWLENKKKLKHP